MDASPTAARRVLLVEDDVELRDALVDALSARGLAVDAVEDGRAALAAMRDRAPDVVLLDLMMPVMDGWEFRLAQRREPALADTPVVALSACRSPSAAAIDADRFLAKPCSAGAIVDAIEEVIALRHRRAAPAHEAQAERMAALGTLAAGVIHEINNPLTYVLLHLHQALRLIGSGDADLDAARAGELRTLVAGALEGAGRIREITRDIRAFARADERARVVLDVQAPLAAAIGMIDHALSHRARLVRAERPTPFVTADEGRLAQVFLNLLTNAIQAMPDGNAAEHEVRIATYTHVDGRAVVEIADTGAGIAPHHLPHVFEPFFSTKPVGEGTGLGLSISHGIIRGFGGELELESTLGRGTTVRVLLPPATARAPQPAPRPQVLVIDPDPAIAAAVRGALPADHDVVTSTSAAHAVELLTTRDYDVVLCDLRLRGLSGPALHARLAAARPRLAARMVFLADAAPDADERRFLATHPHVPRPPTPDRLRAAFAALPR